MDLYIFQAPPPSSLWKVGFGVLSVCMYTYVWMDVLSLASKRLDWFYSYFGIQKCIHLRLTRGEFEYFSSKNMGLKHKMVMFSKTALTILIKLK
jgi:hypothetical protein